VARPLQEELASVTNAQKLISALLVGVICGVVPVIGAAGFAAGAVAYVLTTTYLYRMVLR
jgi:hypothetical protein